MELSVIQIQNKIYEIRGLKVMPDYDLAGLYEVSTAILKRAVKRNIERFPKDFMFELTRAEYNSLRYQIGTLEKGQGRGRYSKYLPYAFTEQGVAMLSSVINSKKAIAINIVIIRTFVMMRQYASNFKELEAKIKKLEKKYNKNFNQVFKALELLLQEKQHHEDFKNRKRIGFKSS
jgi:ORF6N domain